MTLAEDMPAGCVSAVVDEATLGLQIADHIDIGAEIARLDKELGKLSKDIGGLEKRLGNEGFLAKAPAEVVADLKERLTQTKVSFDKLSSAREGLDHLK